MQILNSIFFLSLSVQGLALPQTSPNDQSGGGIFGSSRPSGGLPKGVPGGAPKMPAGLSPIDTICASQKAGGSQAGPNGRPFGNNGSPIQRPGEKCERDLSGGSGPYKSNYTTDSTLPDHTIYAPKTPPPGHVKMPVLIWGNGACMAQGLMYMNMLNELASYGFLVIANGPPIGGGSSKASDLTKAIDWVTTNAAVKKYGSVDASKLAVAGQSCGGLEAYSASYKDPRVKLTVLFNSGLIDSSKAPLLADLKAPVAFFLGGSTDIAQANGVRDYKNLQVPALLASVPVGHIGTYYQPGGGRMGRAGVDFLRWQLKGEESLKSLFCNPSPTSALVADEWKIEAKNGMC